MELHWNKKVEKYLPQKNLNPSPNLGWCHMCRTLQILHSEMRHNEQYGRMDLKKKKMISICKYFFMAKWQIYLKSFHTDCVINSFLWKLFILTTYKIGKPTFVLINTHTQLTSENWYVFYLDVYILTSKFHFNVYNFWRMLSFILYRFHSIILGWNITILEFSLST